MIGDRPLDWVLFHLFILAMLAIDLGWLQRKHQVMTLRQALTWTAVWISCALLFAALQQWSGFTAGDQQQTGSLTTKPAVVFLTAYLVELSLSVDNLFVFILVFRYFAIPPQHQHRALFWGVMGAMVMRLAFILAGVALLNRFHWVAYVFGAILLWTGVKMWRHQQTEIHPEHNPVLRVLRKLMPVSRQAIDGRFVVREDGRWRATPLLVALVMLETTDVVFAVDSVPAVLAVTRQPWIAYTSNVFAILGLRSLYFALAGLLPLFKALHYGLSFILIFIGAKMVVGAFWALPHWMPWASLAVVIGSIAVSVLWSLMERGRQHVKAATR